MWTDDEARLFIINGYVLRSEMSRTGWVFSGAIVPEEQAGQLNRVVYEDELAGKQHVDPPDPPETVTS